MSWEPLICSECKVEAAFERVGQFNPPHSFGVSWLCPSCGARLLDVVPVGVDVPSPGCCLNCGATVDGEQVCGACGLPRAPLVVAIHQHCGDPPEIAAAEALAARGLIRLALNAVDLRLESRPDDPEAWMAKARMLGSVGLGAKTAAPIERALELTLARDPDDLQARVDLYSLLHNQRRFDEALAQLDLALPRLAPGDRVRSLTARAELLCQLQREGEALASVEQALEHMPDDPRTLYTHGWALANLGRLAEARVSMARVVELEPDNGAAARALAQIDAALAGP
ncbi:MAG TPA: tetratricopeptide repeat protein [Enhygromyxa sp.]|nr:tetratricopeptide repeat protein [Enhygromyxa sp.]